LRSGPSHYYDVPGVSEVPALYNAWLEMLGRETDNAVEKFNSLVQPFIYTYDADSDSYTSPDSSLSDYVYDFYHITGKHIDYLSYDGDELFALGYPAEETYSRTEVESIRSEYDRLKTQYLPQANNFVKGTVEYYLNKTIANSNGSNNITSNSTISNILNSVFADVTEPLGNRLENELKTAIDSVISPEFNQYKNALISAISSDNVTWAYIMEAVSDYDDIISQLSKLDSALKELEEYPGNHIFTWEEIAYAVQIFIGEVHGGKYSDEGDGFYNFYLSEDNMFKNLVSLYSDTVEYEVYNRGGTWRYAPYNVEQGPMPELNLGLITVVFNSGDDHTNYSISQWKTCYMNKKEHWCSLHSYSCGTYHDFLIRANGNFSPDNGITPLYNLAVDNNKSVQTDRSIMFRQLVRDMKLSKYSAESSLENINLDILGEYIGKTMYGQTFPTVNKELGASVSVTDSSLAEAMPAVPENFSYDEVEMLLLEINYVKTAMESYKDSLRTAFMLWAASANGTKDAYAAVAKNYTGTIDDMMAEANLKSGNLYYDIYTKVQDILLRLNGTANNLNLIMDEKPDEETDAGAEQPAETSVVAAEKLKNALIPLASDFKYLVTLSTPVTVSRLTLSSEQSVIGDIHSLYSFGENFAAVSYAFNSSNKGTVYTQFTVPEADLMQQAINAAVEGGATNNPADAVNKDAFAIMSDCYGFAIDVLLRTNAEGTNLLLQTDQKQRIYDSQYGEPETLGGGSAITYKTGDMTMAQLEEINKNMRVVFTDTATGEILACAKPYALEEPVEDEFGIYTDETEEEPETGTEGENGEETTEKLPEELMGKLYLCDYTITDSGMLYFGDFYDRANIKPLVKNESTPITVLVYLDGHTINNSAVSGFADLQVNLNLQFASDAELIPTWGYEVDYMRPEEDSGKTETDTDTKTETDTTTGTENGSDTNTDADAENGGTAA
ncbi:MAG: hypothetical protein IJO54_04260, partial [Oscillospiraceae bacterium]|nr:hypothetical protein [Oscillospiraceae bacterium]